MYLARTAHKTLLYVVVWVLTQLGAGASAQAPVLEEDTPQQTWQTLGPSSIIESDSFLLNPTLVAGPEGSLTLSISSVGRDVQRGNSVEVWRWRDPTTTWERLGLPIAGADGVGADGALAHGPAGDAYVCTTSPFRVQRWDGAAWIAVGGDIDEETGWRRCASPETLTCRRARTSTEGCSAIGFDRSGAPVLGFTTREGTKLYANRAARFDARVQAWRALPDEPLSQGRSVHSRLLADEHGTLYMAAFSAGERRGRADVRVLRLRDSNWEPLGEDFHDVFSSTMSIVAGTLHLALAGRDRVIRVWRLGEDGWVALPSPGSGAIPSLAVDARGRPLLAYAIEDASTGGLNTIRLTAFENGAWRSLSMFSAAQVPSVFESLGLVVDDRGRGVIVATRRLPSERYQLVVRRMLEPMN